MRAPWMGITDAQSRGDEVMMSARRPGRARSSRPAPYWGVLPVILQASDAGDVRDQLRFQVDILAGGYLPLNLLLLCFTRERPGSLGGSVDHGVVSADARKARCHSGWRGLPRSRRGGDGVARMVHSASGGDRMKTPSALSSLGELDLNLFYVFWVVYRERSVSRAGRILGLSPSAVSHSIARLRTQVGANLFEPRGGGLVPTAVAHRMALGIEAGLGRLADSVSGSHEFDPRRDVPRVTVAMPALLEPLLLPEIVGPLRRIGPEIEVRSVRLDRAKTKRYLETGVVDAAFDTMDPADPELSSECLLEDTLCVVFSRDRVGPIDRAAYLEAQHVGVSSRSVGADPHGHSAHEAGIAPKRRRPVPAVRIGGSDRRILQLAAHHDPSDR